MNHSKPIKRLLAATLTGVIVSVGACKAPPQKNASAKVQEQEALAYPAQFALTAIPSGWSKDFGLHTLPSSVPLRGSLCWIGYGDNAKRPLKRPLQMPSVQRVLLQPGSTPQVANFQMPSNNPARIGFVGRPLFNGNKNECFFRVSQLGKDYDYYEIYSLNFTTRKAVDEEETLVEGDTFAPSPNGKVYAYDEDNPDSGGDYSVSAYVEGQTKTISDQGASQGFSWTSDNHLLLAAFPKKPDLSRNYGYPDIYESDLKGGVRLVKEGGFRPLLSSDKELLAYIGPDTSLPADQRSEEALRFYPEVVGKVGVFVYNRKRKKEFFVKRIYEQYPDLRWVGDSLYVIENLYIYSKQTSVCRISEFNSASHTLKLLCRLEQKSIGPVVTEDVLPPRFEMIGVANQKFLLFHVPTKPTGANNYHLLTISLQNGLRNDVFSFSAPVPKSGTGYYPYVYWSER